MNSFAPGSRFAGHVIGAELGRGGMGVVYRATHVHLQREVALKILSPRVAADDQFRARFRREAEAAASVHHPNVVPIYDAGEDDGLLYVTMRFVAGVDLARLIAAEERLPAGRATRLVAQVAAALDAAHARGVLHRDVKPANVLIEGQRESEHALLTDFGLTKILHAQTSLTETGALLGTIDYAAPELLSDDHVDARTDVYGLGCVLYEALTGQVPYPRTSAPAKIFAHLEAPVPALSATLPDASPELEDVVRCALAKDPDDRFTSAGELGRAALAAVTQPSRPRPARVAPAARTEAAPAARPNRRRWRVGALLVLGTVVGVGVGMLTIGDRAPRNTGNAAVAPNTASAAVAPSDDAYRAGVVSVCRAVNASERARLRDLKRLRHAVNAAYTTGAQRDAILVATRKVVSRGGRNLADLQSLEPPPASSALHDATVHVWNRSLDRLRGFGERLDRASNRSELRSAIAPYTKARPAAERDSVTLTAGLQRLGGAGCRIHRFNETPVPLPPLREKSHPQPPATGPDVGAGGATGVERPAPTPAPVVTAPPAQPQSSGPDVAPAVPAPTSAPTSAGPDIAPGAGAGGGGGGDG